jgi:hypothetical protein
VKSSFVRSEEMLLRTFKDETVACVERKRHARVDHRVADLYYLSMQLGFKALGAHGRGIRLTQSGANDRRRSPCGREFLDERAYSRRPPARAQVAHCRLPSESDTEEEEGQYVERSIRERRVGHDVYPPDNVRDVHDEDNDTEGHSEDRADDERAGRQTL